ncbi:NEW3 domain-containing protein [Chloroflexota bacterium]
MKIVRIICLLLMGLLALSPLGVVFAQEGEEEYLLTLTPRDGRYDTIILAGMVKGFGVELENLGTAAVDKITFDGKVPEGWALDFKPPRLASLAAFDSETIFAEIGVPFDTEAGDYMVSLSASGEQASVEEIDIRVTVKELIREERIEVKAAHSRLEAIAGAEFAFEVEFRYTPTEVLARGDNSFDLVTTAPQGWEIYMTPPYEKDKHISAITITGASMYGDKTRVVARAPFWPLPEPGEYKITLEAVSGDLRESVELTAVITARYDLIVLPAGERYNTTATAGRDNNFSLQLGNLGTDTIDNINFSSDKPEGWTIDFKPEKVDSLKAIDSQTVDINIKPPPETIAGDYVITVRASGAQATSPPLEIRVTVETPTVWGWVGVGIVVIVIVGLVVIFMRFSRR